ncbi:MAG: hypothetical protein IPH98_15080 [Saprospiraceae bacterium]|nr:hypothetical protein [Candidatus Defluviibacterium haderslevense]
MVSIGKNAMQNTSGCTADLNYYCSVKDAETRRKEMLTVQEPPKTKLKIAFQ